MKIILSSDVELWSWNRNFSQDIEKGVIKLIEFANKEKIPITFFISLSDKGYWEKDYLKKIILLMKKLDGEGIEFGVHSHCKNLPLEFPTLSDNLKDYPLDQAVKIIKWYKKQLEKILKKNIRVHRAGGYQIPSPNTLSRIFNTTGLKIDSSALEVEYSSPRKFRNLIEISPATNKKYSKKLIVWGPEQMSNKELLKFYKKAKTKTKVLVINFHSFSVHGFLGKKAKIWHKLPNWLRKILRPFTKKFKENSKNNLESESPHFKNLKKIIRFLKEQECEFVKFKDFL